MYPNNSIESPRLTTPDWEVNHTIDLSGLEFGSEEWVKAEFKGISRDVIDLNVSFVPDVVYDDVTHEVISTPIADALGITFVRSPTSEKGWEKYGRCKGAALFYGEDGDLWHSKIFWDILNEKRTGEYRAKKGSGDKPYLPSIPSEIIRKHAIKISPLCEASWLECRENSGQFWEWVKGWPQIPIIITEGAKKALAAISQGHIALSLYGCYCGSKDLMVKPELLPYVEGRHVIIAFDEDLKPETRHKVFGATKRLGSAIAYRAKGTVSIASWDGNKGKGIDDLIANDPKLFHKAIADSKSLDRWRLMRDFDLSGMVSLTFDTKNLAQSINFLPPQKIVAIKSPKKTYKTELLSKWVAPHLSQGGKVLVPPHREQLAKALANRLGIEYRTELTKEGKIFGYSLCIDSLHPKANPPFKADEWEDCWLIFDEADQVIWHLLGSETCKYNRPAILESVTQLANVASKIFLVSADLNKVCINWVQSLLETPAETYVIENEYQHSSRDCFVYNSFPELFLKTKELIEQGQKLIIHTGGQSVDSTWGTTNLEKMLTKDYPFLKILRVDRESTGEVGHAAVGVIENVNTVFPRYDIVVCSPTIETGVSIETEHFDAVICFALGSQTVDAIGQTIERYRKDVPRHICATERAHHHKIGNGSVHPWTLIHGEKELSELNKKLAKADDFAKFELDIQSKHLETWGKLAAYHNIGFNSYRNSIYEMLEKNGFSLYQGSSETPRLEQTKEEAKSSAETGKAEYCEKIAAAPILEGKDYETLKNKRLKTEAETYSEKASSLALRYAADTVSPDLVSKDMERGWHLSLRLHYYLTVGNDFLKDRDQSRIKALAEGSGDIFIPDLNKNCLTTTVTALKEFINLEQWLDCDRIFSKDDPDLIEWHEKIIKLSHLRTVTGVSVGSDPTAKGNSPIDCLKRFLKPIGLKLVCVGRKREQGSRFKTFKIESLDPDGRQAIFARWVARDQKKPEAHAPAEIEETLDGDRWALDRYKYINKNTNRVPTLKNSPDPEVVSEAGGFVEGQICGYRLREGAQFRIEWIEPSGICQLTDMATGGARRAPIDFLVPLPQAA